MLIIPAIIEGVATRRDRTIKVTLGTNELTPEQASELYKFSNDIVYCALKKDNFASSEKEILEGLKADDDLSFGTKTQSQRIRAVLYKNWEQKPQGFKQFKDYYEHQTEQIISYYKNKLE